jgi:hypothetical protein
MTFLTEKKFHKGLTEQQQQQQTIYFVQTIVLTFYEAFKRSSMSEPFLS